MVQTDDIFMRFVMEDRQWLGYWHGDRDVKCSCGKKPCEHIRYLQSVISILSDNNLNVLLDQKSSKPITPLTGRQCEDFRNALIRSYNYSEGVVRQPASTDKLGWIFSSTDKLGWNGDFSFAGRPRRMRVIKHRTERDGSGDIFVSDLTEGNEFSEDIIRFLPGMFLRGCTCSSYKRVERCAHMEAATLAIRAWRENGLLQKEIQETQAGNTIPPPPVTDFSYIENAQPVEWRYTNAWSLRGKGFVGIDPGKKEEEPKPKPKPKTRFSDLEL